MTNPTQQSGNQNTTASFADVCIALKNNVMRNTHVAELVIVKSIGSTIKCSLLTNPAQTIECIALSGLDVKVDDVMLTIFTLSDFRTNLTKLKRNQSISKIEKQTLHSINHGVLIGLVYRKETNTEDTK